MSRQLLILAARDSVTIASVRGARWKLAPLRSLKADRGARRDVPAPRLLRKNSAGRTPHKDLLRAGAVSSPRARWTSIFAGTRRPSGQEVSTCGNATADVVATATSVVWLRFRAASAGAPDGGGDEARE